MLRSQGMQRKGRERDKKKEEERGKERKKESVGVSVTELQCITKLILYCKLP